MEEGKEEVEEEVEQEQGVIPLLDKLWYLGKEVRVSYAWEYGVSASEPAVTDRGFVEFCKVVYRIVSRCRGYAPRRLGIFCQIVSSCRR